LSAKPDGTLDSSGPQQPSACHAYLDELGRGNVDEVEPSYPICCDYRPSGGLPSGHLAENRVRTHGIYLLLLSIWQFEKVTQDVYPFFCP